MATVTKFQDFVEQLGKGVHNFASHTIKVALTNSAPNAATNTVLADITQIANGNGYVTGGMSLANVVWSETGGTATLSCDDQTLTASGGSVGPFRYAVFYNDTPTSPADPLIGYVDYGSSITVLDGDNFVLDFSTGIIQIA